MKFTRKKHRGQNQKTRRTWYSEEGYRIIWRKEVYGIEVLPRYQACVKTLIPNYRGIEGLTTEVWDLVDWGKHLCRTMKAAEDACKRHHQLWIKACEATGIRTIIDLFGKVPIGIPMWALSQLNPRARAVLLAHYTPRVKCIEDTEDTDQNQSPQELLKSSAEPEPESAAPPKTRRRPRKTGPVTPASEKDESSVSPESKPARPARGRAKAKRAIGSKRGAKPTASTRRRGKSTSDTRGSSKGSARGSQAKKSKRSGS